MTPSACSPKGKNAFNTNAARENINKHLQNSRPTVKGGRIVERVHVTTRNGLLANVDPLHRYDTPKSDVEHIYSKHLPSTNQAAHGDPMVSGWSTANHERKSESFVIKHNERISCLYLGSIQPK